MAGKEIARKGTTRLQSAARPFLEVLEPRLMLDAVRTPYLMGVTTDSVYVLLEATASSPTATVDYGDGTGGQPLTLNGDKTVSLIHLYADDGSYTVTVTVTDDDSDSGSDPLTVTVNNVLPTVSATNDGPKAEEAAVTVTASQTDPGTSDTFTYSLRNHRPGKPIGF